MTALLLVKGADVNLINNLGEDPLHVAAGGAETAIKAFKEGDLFHFKKHFTIVSPFIGTTSCLLDTLHFRLYSINLASEKAHSHKSRLPARVQKSLQAWTYLHFSIVLKKILNNIQTPSSPRTWILILYEHFLSIHL